VRLVLWLAVTHWLFYALIGFFTDDLRFSLHWTLYSHALLLMLASLSQISVKWTTAAISTGLVCGWALQWLLLNWSQPGAINQAYQDRFTANSRGWETLAAKTKEVADREGVEQLIADHFMTLATVLYHNREAAVPATVLSHPLNIKHGRERQLQIMGYLPETRNTNDKTLVIIEQTALTLEQQIPFYLQTCEQLGGLQWIDQLNIDQGLKIHHFFLINDSRCELPPISYAELHANHLTGWVLAPLTATMRVELETGQATHTKGSFTMSPLGDNPLFSQLDARQYGLLNFSFDWPESNGTRGQLKFIHMAHTSHGPAIYRD
jgi:hypothetical protein